MKKYHEWAFGPESFFLIGTFPIGVLLLHGLTGSAAEMRLLGEYLHGKGYTVFAPLLPGHGSDPEELVNCTQQDFYEAALAGYQKLANQYGIEKVYLIGQSMGALLSLKLLQNGFGEKAALLAAPVFLHQRFGEWAKYLHYFKKFATRRKKGFRYQGKMIYPGYHQMPLKTLASTLILRKEVLGSLEKVSNEILLVYSRDEHTVRPESSDYLKSELKRAKTEQFWIENSGHTITLDRQRDQVFKKINQFFEEDGNEECPQTNR